jgi:hypothetical protein
MSKKTEDTSEEQTTALTSFIGGGNVAAYDYGDDAGAGFEHSESTDFATPIIYVSQSSSAYVKDGDGSIRGGMLYNNVTGEAVEADIAKGKPGIVFIPCAYIHTFNEWRPRASGGGLVEQHDPNSPVVLRVVNDPDQKFGKYKIRREIDGEYFENDLVDTFTVFGLTLDEKTRVFEQAVVPHSSTKISIFKRFLQCKRNMLIPGTRKSFPMYSHAWRLQTKGQVNKGESSYNIVWSLAYGPGTKSMLDQTSELYEAARSVYMMCSDKEAMSAVVTKSVSSEKVSGSGDDITDVNGDEIEIPF